MRKTALYSRAVRRRKAAASVLPAGQPTAAPAPAFDAGPSDLGRIRAWIAQRCGRHPRTLLVITSVVLSLALGASYILSRPRVHVLTQGELDAAVRYTLSHTPPAPADSARAAAIIRPTVVAVEGFLSAEHAAAVAAAAAKGKPSPRPRGLPDKSPAVDAGDEPRPDSIGTGVVVKEDGTIMTALHVVSSTDRWTILFADGSKSNATLVGSQPENDLAILRAEHVPDEQPAAVLASTARLRPGDTVVATGFPFGIGPSVTSGVVSGLRREFTEPSTNRKFTNLIQFDAAVNPGNSGGPLVDRDGEVVGIVTALLNPTDAEVFVGIGFAVPIENAAKALGQNPM
jgi:serine protease DegQ